MSANVRFKLCVEKMALKIVTENNTLDGQYNALQAFLDNISVEDFGYIYPKFLSLGQSNNPKIRHLPQITQDAALGVAFGTDKQRALKI